MKRIAAVVCAIILVVSFASAQSLWGQGKMSVGVGGELSLPMGSWGDDVGIGFGGVGLFQYGLNENLLLTGQLGYTLWTEKDQGGVKTSGSALTILGGAKYALPTVSQGFYALAQAGIYSASITVDVPPVVVWGVTIGGGKVTSSDSKFVICPGVGYQFGNIDASVKYVINSDISNLALNIHYIIPL